MNAKISNPLRRGIARWFVAGVMTAGLAAPVGAQNDTVEVSEQGTVTLTVKDTDLAQVLEMLSIQSRKNIITSKQVSATISANLYDVTFYEALDAILRVNGYGYIEEGNFIYVYTQAELEQIREQRRARESRVFELDYLAAADAYEFITPLLSENGAASYRGDVPGGFKPEVGDGGADSYAFTPTLVVNDYPENLEAIAAVLSDLDRAPKQVLVEATVLQTSLDESNAFGVDFSVLGSLDFTDLTRPLSPVTDLLNGSEDGIQPDDNDAVGAQATPGATSGPGTLKVGFISNDISVFIRVLDEVSDTTVLARPKIMVLNRQRAEVLVGARVGYLSTTATETTTTQSVEFLDTGIQLILRPFVSDSGMIRMELAPSVSEASLRTVTDANGLLVTIPDELTNELTTNVRVPDGQTLVLGGLFRESTRVTRRQIPVFGDIPILGAAFRGQEDTVDRDEIIFLITPSIVADESLLAAGEGMTAYAEAARVGARDGLLPFSQEKLINRYNREAMDAYARGDLDRALHYTNLSLHLRPRQPEMIKFREQITGDIELTHEQSTMERAIRRQLGTLMPDPPHKEAVGPLPMHINPSANASMFGFSNGLSFPGAPASNANVAEQQRFYDDLFQSFFEELGMPEMADAATGTAAAAGTPDAEFPFETFEEPVEISGAGGETYTEQP